MISDDRRGMAAKRFTEFAPLLLRWWNRHGRKDLPWQIDPSPYRVWVSEIMLQQTQVATVIPFFERFMQRFDSLKTLADASLDEVLGLWSGLGYYARARNLHRAAGYIQQHYQGRFPSELDRLISLPGIGRSTAAAILALSDNQSHAILDGNVKRVLSRLHAVAGYSGDAATLAALWALSEQHTPAVHAARYTQAIMDLGATVCTRRKPECTRCPVRKICAAYELGLVEQLPASRPRKTLPVRAAHFVVICDSQRRFLLERRAGIGIWGGLWCFPQCEHNDDWRAWLAATLRLEIETARSLPMLKHGFTHYKLEIHPLLIELDKPDIIPGVADIDRYRFYDIAELESGEVGLPKPVRAILESVNRLVNR